MCTCRRDCGGGKLLEQDKKEVKKTHKITLQDLTEKIDSMNKEEFILQIDLESEDADE